MKTGTKRAICMAAGGLLWLAFYCVIGSMDRGTIGAAAGGILAAVCEILGAFCLWKAGVIRLG